MSLYIEKKKAKRSMRFKQFVKKENLILTSYQQLNKNWLIMQLKSKSSISHKSENNLISIHNIKIHIK